jgi:hypothetical protein
MLGAAVGALLSIAVFAAPAARAASPEITPTGQAITPTAAPGAIFQPLNPDLPGDPAFTAGQASAMALSPDRRTLLIMTTGFNRNFGPDGKFIADRSSEYVFVYDVSGARPVKRQVLTAPNTFLGLAWAPAGDRFFVSGGVDDDVLEFVGAPGAMRAGRVFRLGHTAGLGLEVKPEAAGLAVSPDGHRLLVANFQNDSVSLVDLASGSVSEQDLRPGVIDRARVGRPGGTFPRALIWAGDTKAYVASQRDREIIVLGVSAHGECDRASPPSVIRPRSPQAAQEGSSPPSINTDAALVIDNDGSGARDHPPNGPIEWRAREAAPGPMRSPSRLMAVTAGGQWRRERRGGGSLMRAPSAPWPGDAKRAARGRYPYGVVPDRGSPRGAARSSSSTARNTGRSAQLSGLGTTTPTTMPAAPINMSGRREGRLPNGAVPDTSAWPDLPGRRE